MKHLAEPQSLAPSVENDAAGNPLARGLRQILEPGELPLSQVLRRLHLDANEPSARGLLI